MSNNNGFPKDHISVSQINLYLMCPLKYRFTYVDQLSRPFKPANLALGSAIHSALAWWHRQRMDGIDPEGEEVARVFAADFNAQKVDNVTFGNGGSEDQLIERGRKMLAVYLREYFGGPVMAVEMPFRVPLVDKETGETLELPLDGIIDLVEENDTVSELKTAGRSFSLFDVEQHLQLTAYHYAYEWLYKRLPRLRLDCLLRIRNPRLESCQTERSQDDTIRFFHIAKAVTQAIKAKNYYPKPGWQCAECEFYVPCQKWRINPPNGERLASSTKGGTL
jgi:putative RecB family exonuclease